MEQMNLDMLLQCIRDGASSRSDVARARALLAEDGRVPPGLRHALDDDDDLPASAGALMGVLGLDDGLFGSMLGAALSAESGGMFDDLPAPWDTPAAEPEISAGELAEQEEHFEVPVGAAVRVAAGEVEVAVDVLTALGFRLSVPVAEAVQEEASRVDVTAGVELSLAVAAAVEEEAGNVELADQVLASLGLQTLEVASSVRREAGEVDLAEAVVHELGWELIAVAAAVCEECGSVEVVAGVLGALGEESVPVAQAVRAQAGTVDLAGDVLRALGYPGVPIGDAVRDAAGVCDVASSVMRVVEPGWISAMLDNELGDEHRLAVRRLREDPFASAEMTRMAQLGRELRASILVEAGEVVSVWEGVAAELDIAVEAAAFEVPVGAAVVGESGEVDVAEDVMVRVGRSAVADVPVIPEPANNRRWLWSGVALAAIALFTVLVGGRLFTATDGSPDVASRLDDSGLEFAAADEITVDDLTYADDVFVQIRHDDDPEAPLIIIVDDEVTL
jgi:hypothetical protein